MRWILAVPAAVLIAGCSSAAITTTTTTTTHAASPACPEARATVQTVEQEISAGNLTSAEANGWATLLDTAGQAANRYNTGPGPARQLAGSLVHAQGEAVILSLDLGDGGSSESTDQAQLMTYLKSAAADCGG